MKKVLKLFSIILGYISLLLFFVICFFVGDRLEATTYTVIMVEVSATSISGSNNPAIPPVLKSAIEKYKVAVVNDWNWKEKDFSKAMCILIVPLKYKKEVQKALSNCNLTEVVISKKMKERYKLALNVKSNVEHPITITAKVKL